MVNDIKIPDFNLDDNFSIDGENAPTKPKKAKVEDEQPIEEEFTAAPAAAAPVAAAAPAPEATKPKPKLLFEEEEESVEIMNPSAAFKHDTKKVENPLKQKAKPPEKQKPAKPEKPIKIKIKKERKPMKLKYFLIPLVVIVLGGGAFFAYTNGYVGRLISKVSSIKNSFFATDSLAIADHANGDNHDEDDEDAEHHEEAHEERKPASPYESEFLRKPAATQQNKTTTATKPKEEAKPASTSARTTTSTKATTSTTPARATTTHTTTSTNQGIPGKYSIQVSAWQEEHTAKNEVRKIADNRLSARVVTANLGQRGTWYRVMVGSYSTEEEAKRDLNRVMRTTGYQNCFVREN